MIAILVMRALAILAPVLAGACQYDARPVDSIDGAGDDVPPGDGPAPPDARIDATPTDPCLEWSDSWGGVPAEFDPCGILPPTAGQITISSGTWTLDNAGVLTNGVSTIVLAHSTVANVAVISVEHLDVLGSATLRLVGPDPIAIAVWTDATIDGTIDASSDFEDPGAGAGPPTCPTSNPGDPDPGGNQSGGDGGSGGGGFQGNGGDGSDGNGGSGNGDGGGGGDGRPLPARIEGGCSGAPAQSGTSGYAGVGGGAVMIAVLDTLTVGGTIDAGGGGGGGATGGGSEAGGGGGSGGMIKLEARSLTLLGTAVLAANGGQGGGGNHNNDASPGEDGRADDTEAVVSNNEGGGGDGGGGGYVGRVNGANGTPNPSNDGGGGGGGGAGYIVYGSHGQANVSGTATISPTAQQL